MSNVTMLDLAPLEAHVANMESLGCTVANLGRARLPDGYEVMLNADGTHYFWINWKGQNSVIHWNKWAAFRGAKEHAKGLSQ